MRRPCLALSRARSSGGLARSSGRNSVSVPTGLISVMPQPCVTSMSQSRVRVSIMACGTAEPPLRICCKRFGLRPRFLNSSISPSQTVGTPQPASAPSLSINS